MQFKMDTKLDENCSITLMMKVKDAKNYMGISIKVMTV
jgi:hypothetical protein